MWPAAISRASLDPYYGRIEAGLRVNRPGWDGVSKSGGVWAAMCDHSGHTCDRVPVAISPERCRVGLSPCAANRRPNSTAAPGASNVMR